MIFKKKANDDSPADIEFRKLSTKWNRAFQILQARAEDVIAKQGTLSFYIDPIEEKKALERSYNAKQELAKAITEYNNILTTLDTFIIDHIGDFANTNPLPRKNGFSAQDVIERVYKAFFKK